MNSRNKSNSVSINPAAVQSSKYGARVAIVEKKSAFGGPTGLTSKAVRFATKAFCGAIAQIGGDRRKQISGLWRRRFSALRSEAEVCQAKETRSRLDNNGIDLFIGEATISDSFPIEGVQQTGCVVRVCRPSECVELRARFVCVATGSRPHMPSHFAPGIPLNFSSSCIVTATEMGNMAKVPTAVAVLGGGIIAVEYATVLATLGVGVSLLCKDEEFMPFLEGELRDALRRRMRRSHVLFVSEAVVGIQIDPSDTFARVALAPPTLPPLSGASNISVPHTSGSSEEASRRPRLSRTARSLKVDLVMCSAGRDANSEGLGLEAHGCAIGKYGRIQVDKNGRSTGVPEIYAVGDVIGPPGLASAAQQQARDLAAHLFDSSHVTKKNTFANDRSTDEEEEIDVTEVDSYFTVSEGSARGEDEPAALFGPTMSAKPGSLARPDAAASVPLTLWTIPEVASVGISRAQAEARLAARGADRVVVVEGYAYFRDMARGRLSGDMDGFLKIVTSHILSPSVAGQQGQPPHHHILGVFIFGEGANELIQLGSVLLAAGATVEQVSRTPFAAVTLCALFQMACDDALLKIKRLQS